MRIALITFFQSAFIRGPSIVDQLVTAATEAGNTVTVIDGTVSGSIAALATYDYLAIAAVPKGPFGGLSNRVKEFLRSNGSVSGRRGCALICGGLFFRQKTCTKLMHVLEAEGMMLDYFEVVDNHQQARQAGTKLG